MQTVMVSVAKIQLTSPNVTERMMDLVMTPRSSFSYWGTKKRGWKTTGPASSFPTKRPSSFFCNYLIIVVRYQFKSFLFLFPSSTVLLPSCFSQMFNAIHVFNGRTLRTHDSGLHGSLQIVRVQVQ